MAPIKKNQVLTEGAIKAPLELAENFQTADQSVKKMLDTLTQISKNSKAVDINLDLAKSTRQVAEETKNLGDAERELEKIDKRIAVAQARQNDEYIQRERQLQDIRKETKRLVNEQDELLGTEAKLIKRNKELIAERRALRKEDEDYVKRLKEINEELDENTEFIKENSSQQEQLRFQVGGYREQLEGLTVQLFEASQQKGGITALFQATRQGLIASTRAALAFIATPIGLVLAAVAAGIALITTAVNNNQSAADDFNRIWGVISSVLEEVFSRVVRLSSAFVKLLQGDFQGAVDEAGKAFTNLADSIRAAAIEGLRLVNLQIELERATINATTATALLSAEIEKQNLLADDATRSFAERERAATQAREREAELAQINLDLAQREVDIINLQVEQARRRGTLFRELEQEQADAQANLIEAQSQALLAELENEKVRRELRQDRLERDLDILIDGFDNVKTINERIINDDRRTIRARTEGLEELTRLSEQSFNRQIETIRKFTNVAFDENQLLQEQDAVRLNQQIRNLGLSEIIEGRLLEIIRERRIVLADLNDSQRGIDDAQIARLQEIADNELNTTEVRIQAILKLAETRSQLLDQQLSEGVLNEQEFADKIVKIQEEASREINKLNLERFDSEFEDQQLDAETARINQLIELNQQFRDGEITSLEDFEAAKLQIEGQSQKDRLNAELDFLEQRKEILEQSGVDTSAIDKQIAEVRLQILEATNAEILDKESEVNKALVDLRDAVVESSLQVLSNFNQREDEERARRLENINEQEEQELSLIQDAQQREGESEEAFAARQEAVEERKAQVQEEFAARREQVERQQREADRRRAIFEKALAATEVGIQTGVAIVKAVAASPLTGGLPFSAIAAAIGAVQLAAILTKPIPQFAEGTDSAPKGFAIINEQGPELIMDRGVAKMINTDGPTLTYFRGGEKIIPNDQLNLDPLSNLILTNEGVIDMSDFIKDQKKGFRMVVRALQSLNRESDNEALKELVEITKVESKYK